LYVVPALAAPVNVIAISAASAKPRTVLIVRRNIFVLLQGKFACGRVVFVGSQPLSPAEANLTQASTLSQL
jgi:hypothetical protein